MVIGTLVRLEQQDRTECRVWPPCEYVVNRGSWRQNGIIDVARKRQVPAFRPNIGCSDDNILGELALNGEIHLISARPHEIRRYREKASASGECPVIGKWVAAGKSIIRIDERSPQGNSLRVCTLIDVREREAGGKWL